MTQLLSSGWCLKGGPLSYQCNPRIRRNALSSLQGFPAGFNVVSLVAQENMPDLKVSGSSSATLAVSRPAVRPKKDSDHSGQSKTDSAVQDEEEVDEDEMDVEEREKLRRRRIGAANKGKAPWNKGRKHSPQTIQRIRERTFQAMHSPTVMAKLKLNPRHSQTKETRLKIRDKLRAKWGIKKKIRGYQEAMSRDWRRCVAEAARLGGLAEEELEWNSYSIIKKQIQEDAAALCRIERAKKKKEAEEARAKLRSPGKSEEHRLKIAAAIKAKWEDPEYQAKVRMGMLKYGNARGMLKNGDTPRPRRRAPPRTPQEKRHPKESERAPRENAPWAEGSGVVVGPLDQSFITAVMCDEKRNEQRNLTMGRRDSSDSNYSASEPSRSRPQTRTHRRVNLLKRTESPSGKEGDESLSEVNRRHVAEPQISEVHSPVDLLPSENLQKRKLIEARRSMMDQRRREATMHARAMMVKADRAVKVLEADAGDNEFVLASLNEMRRIMAEAADFIRTAESAEVFGASPSVDVIEFQDGRVSLAQHQSLESQLQIDSRENHDMVEMNSGSSKMSLPSGQVTTFGSEMRVKAVWEIHSGSNDDSTAKSRFPTNPGLDNGLSKTGEDLIAADGLPRTRRLVNGTSRSTTSPGTSENVQRAALVKDENNESND